MSAWTAFYWGDYLRDTMGLSLIEHGAYIKLLTDYYCGGGPLTLDRNRLHRVCGAHTKSERDAVDTILDHYFEKTADGYRNSRADEEIEKRALFVEAGKKGAAKRWGKGQVTQFPQGRKQ